MMVVCSMSTNCLWKVIRETLLIHIKLLKGFKIFVGFCEGGMEVNHTIEVELGV
ncbi:hypothetical protein HanPSC8_Chr02g0054681 [Helianthus annuus]|nr:hypothetical protein HanPSC8_Chr02g0054681 [Helianthus annuus]